MKRAACSRLDSHNEREARLQMTQNVHRHQPPGVAAFVLGGAFAASKTTGRGPVCCLAGKQRQGASLPAAVALNYASTWQDILDVALARSNELRQAHFTTALLRVAKLSVRNTLRTERKRIREDDRLNRVLELAFGDARDLALRHLSDAVWASALLQVPCVEGRMVAALQSLGEGFPRMSTEDVTKVAWSAERLQLADKLPPSIWTYVKGLPFEVLQGALTDLNLTVEHLKDEVILNRDMITLNGRELGESRLTAWQHENGRPFLYSGKCMEGPTFTPVVRAVATRLAELTGVNYDGCLINYYADGQTGMRYHSDPDQGTYWTTDTAVVSIGDTRQFIFRRADDYSMRHVYYVTGGDVVIMRGDCQERFQHCVKVESNAEDCGPRMSLVYKRSLVV
eukprot:Plantae.Rhodophyta-Purpureofilum_apyrenoidigerum.ctg9229.p1 GENE.Plantae.Rhodophyta-Purpureofilum_apyrenoidigerum.ctg9229~~Plantae.Rhodophyta-Purpureofilum_apyrenoidigerum.ctg9229.p1  ORF type:complete len:396 (+),score=51.31 Plantae.Rhodophyta-Purpureofilum_apyrenoidigerum.ctg9229:164-1351(+)